MTNPSATSAQSTALSICKEIEDLTPETVERWIEKAINLEVTFTNHSLRHAAILINYFDPTVLVTWRNTDLFEVWVEETSIFAIETARSFVLAEALDDAELWAFR